MWLFYLFFGFIAFTFVYDRLTIGYLNPYKLIMIFGKKGSGKTTFLTRVALDFIRKGRKVYSTVHIPGTYYFNVDDIGRNTFEPNSVVLIDEVGMIWDNRDFKNFKSNVRDFFKFQRQYKLTIYLFSQTFDVDVKLRNLTDEMYLLRNVGRIFSVARRIEKNITIKDGTDGQPSTLADDYRFSPLLSARSFQITWIPRYVDFFKSYDPKELPVITGDKYMFTDEQLGLIKHSDFFFNKTVDWLSKLFYSIRTPNFFRKRK